MINNSTLVERNKSERYFGIRLYLDVTTRTHIGSFLFEFANTRKKNRKAYGEFWRLRDDEDTDVE